MTAALFTVLFMLGLMACGDDGDDSASTTPQGDDQEQQDDGGDDEGGDDGGGEFCDKASEIANNTELEELDFEDPADLAVAEGVLEDFSDVAPEEIKDDLAAVVEGFRAVVAAGDDPEAQAALQEDLAGLEEASTRLEEFVLEECGVDLDGADADAEIEVPTSSG